MIVNGPLKMAVFTDKKCPFWVLQQCHTVSVIVDPARLSLQRSERLDILINRFPLNSIVIIRVSLLIRGDIVILGGEGVCRCYGGGVGWGFKEGATELF